MRARNSKTLKSDLLVAALALAASAGMIFWFTLMPREAVAERKAAIAGSAINSALTAYAFNHHGEYPPTDSITGGGTPDTLVRSGFIMFYPPNPFEPSRKCAKVAHGVFSPGDFVYERNPDKVYEYRLIMYGASRTSGKAHDGAVYYHGYD